MNITRENLGELDLSIKIEVAENDYAEKVTKQLKMYRAKANVPGFRKGMAPMSLIQRMYKSTVVAEVVQDLLGESLYKYIEDEKLEIVGSPLSNGEKTGDVDFENGKDFAFYFDAALMPQVNLAWDKVDAKLCQIKMTAKDVEKQIDEITKRYGNFETPETVGEHDYVYGKAVELDKDGNVKEGGMSTFCSFELSSMKDAEISALFVGKKAEEKVVFNAGKAFTAAELEKAFRLEAAAAKKFKADVEFTISGCSRITPHEINEELFEKVYPGKDIKDLAAFKKAVEADMDKANAEQCEILYVNNVRKVLMDNFDAPIPEAFLKRWLLNRGEKDVTAESIEADWAEKYLPGLKWEFVDAALEKIKPINATRIDILDAIKDIIRPGQPRKEEESDEEFEKRLDEIAMTIAKDENNLGQLRDKIYVKKCFELFKDQLHPEEEKVTPKEFAERCK